MFFLVNIYVYYILYSDFLKGVIFENVMEFLDIVNLVFFYNIFFLEVM